MKAVRLLAVTLALPLLTTGCLRDESFPELLMGSASMESAALVATSPEALVSMMPTAAGTAELPAWKTLSYSEDLGDAYAERSFALIETHVMDN